MRTNNHIAERWVETTIREHARGAVMAGMGYLLVAFVGVVLWFGVAFGLMFMGAIVLTSMGISPNEYKYVVLALYVVQCGLYLFVRQKNSDRWEVSADVDGGVYVVPPDRAASADHGLMHRGILKSLFFAIPIALEEAFQEFARAARIRRVDRPTLARLTDKLFESQKKVTFDELGQQIGTEALKTAVEDASVLPGFQLFANDPQGVSLTSSAIEEFTTV